MNIAICDDDNQFRVNLEKNLVNYYNEKKIPLNILNFDCGEKMLENSNPFDIVFLDVEMNGINGIHTGHELKNRNPNAIIIITTSFNGYLDDAFKIQAFRFLSKPLNIIRLYKALDDAIELMRNDVIVFYDMKSGSNIKINTKEIIFIEIEKKKTKIVTTKGDYYSNKKISFWKDKLNAISFVCPHSSFITNLDYSIEHTRTKLVLANKDKYGNVIEKYNIAIAPKKQSEIKNKFFYVLTRR